MDLIDKEQYENIIGLLKNALIFYSEERNYSSDDGITPRIQLDGGEQARFILNQLKSIEKNISDTEYSYDELIKNAQKDNDINSEDIINKIRQFNNEGTNN